MIKVNDLVLYEVDALYTDPMTFNIMRNKKRDPALVIDVPNLVINRLFYKIFVTGHVINVTSVNLKEFE